MKSGKLSVALIGAGRAGMIHARNFRAGVPDARLTAVADPAPGAAEAAGKELEIDRCVTDYHELLEDASLDAVIIVTPTKYHCEIAVDAAKAGKHILCEKPMAMTVEECNEMDRAARENGVKLQLAFMRRFDASFVKAKRLIEEGAIGDVVMVRSNTRGPSTPQPWMYDIRKSNGPLAEVNSHDIDTLRWFTGSDFVSLYAVGGNYRCPDAKKEFPDFYDNVVLNGSFANGCQGLIDGAQGVQYGYDARAEILGTRGCIYLGQTREDSVTLCSSDKIRSQEYMNSWRYLFRDAYLEEDKAFARMVLEDSDPPVTAYDGKMAVLTVNAGNLSIREKRIVRIDGDRLI
ncbi:MAG TPA: Gfo/Idh/MocA family oxidoreductase [Firmicutes bacterium]|nr:Gfo/Idh/MocA family oxidoreductase [Bacillota bacterium]